MHKEVGRTYSWPGQGSCCCSSEPPQQGLSVTHGKQKPVTERGGHVFLHCTAEEPTFS